MRMKPPKHLWVLFDADGVFAGTFATRQEAEEDAWGPRFRKGYRVRCYSLVPRGAETPRRAPNPVA